MDILVLSIGLHAKSIQMKKFFVVILAQLLSLLAFCRPVMNTEPSTDPKFTDIDLKEEFLDIAIYFLLENTRSDTAFITWAYRIADPDSSTTA